MLNRSISGACLALFCALPCSAGERPSFNKTRDPRPDILPYWVHNTLPEYRKVYNRPRFWPGWLASKIAPSSQEAMVWRENADAGAYNHWHTPARYKRYFAPKPWEVLQTGARPDFKKPNEVNSATPPANINSAPPADAPAEITAPLIDPYK